MFNDITTRFTQLEQMWKDYSAECIEDLDLHKYTLDDVRDDFYCGASAALALLKQGVSVEDIRKELDEWGQE